MNGQPGQIVRAPAGPVHEVGTGFVTTQLQSSEVMTVRGRDGRNKRVMMSPVKVR